MHNAYQQRGGEDAVVDAEEALLKRHGHAVIRYQRHNEDITTSNRPHLARDALWSRRTSNDIARLIREFRADVVHVHNTLPLISPSVYWAAHRLEVPVVQTLHNFRLICPQAMLLRNGKVCEDCVGHVPWRAVVHRCYRKSALESAVVAITVQAHRVARTWHDKVSLYIALNEFCKAKLIEGGLPGERIRVKPNFVDLPSPPIRERRGFLFVGRLSNEKGLAVMAGALRTLANAAVELRVAGSGPDADQISNVPGVQVMGAIPPAAIYEQMIGATALVLPSIWYENFPRTLVEAYANGLPVIASRLGALATLVSDGETGLLFNPGCPDDLALKLQWAMDNSDAMQRMGIAARQRYERDLTGDVNYSALIGIYTEAIALTRQREAPLTL